MSPAQERLRSWVGLTDPAAGFACSQGFADMVEEFASLKGLQGGVRNWKEEVKEGHRWEGEGEEEGYRREGEEDGLQETERDYTEGQEEGYGREHCHPGATPLGEGLRRAESTDSRPADRRISENSVGDFLCRRACAAPPPLRGGGAWGGDPDSPGCEV